ncbi:aspartyl-tRNA(Asn)/glutamyl-tRNA (Gln) amidotransferase subunit B (plasmid) [Legionella adelaidensis]|uniref:Aspartyl/glutamyl-tRNA(Asn/Gln) amidotransferase subunit B n=2 Tax=Legionella adelaidensis TaxID=45056 RepID=A0A0W0R4A7_9GAMM|nr:aspartyl/glutamyl-tRNA amidotransferase subunit B [Legionella adelaidensis]VEH85539.1 aspartyl-tRNA(Asn)/glutamyl-tRNA (Gln) amidotransferase subunit B [Legionella adelaidensis]
MWETVIGLEVHVQLKTKTKLFSGASTAYGAEANSQTSFIDAALPGVLPVLNENAVVMAIRLGIALQAQINEDSFFERKNYFYPDLPKGYQISQFQRPIVSNGHLNIDIKGQTKKVNIVRAHLEEDAGKSIHEAHSSSSMVDLNRAGTPLLEVVTAPCLYSAEEAITYLKTLHQLVRFLDICDGNMQEGSFRCDVNLSLRPKGTQTLGTRTELKNLNSFRFIEKAIEYEQIRHQELLESGHTISQETRLYSPTTNSTIPMRSKENENDYRYFPDPDLLPIKISPELINKAKSLILLPWSLKKELLQNEKINEEEAEFLLSSPSLYYFFNEVKKKTNATTKLILNWLRGTYSAVLNDMNLSFENPPIGAADFAYFLSHIEANQLTSKNAKEIFLQSVYDKIDIKQLITAAQKETSSNQDNIEEIIKNIIQQNPMQVAEFQAGKDKLLAFFVGQVMKATKGSANPNTVNELLLKHLKK